MRTREVWCSTTRCCSTSAGPPATTGSRPAPAPISAYSTRCRPTAASSPAWWSDKACTWPATTRSSRRPGLDGTGVPNFNPASGLDTQRSDYVAGVYISPVSGLSLIAQARFDERDFTLRRQDTALQGTYGPLLTQVAYTYTQFDPKFGVFDDQQEIIGTLGLRLTDRWSVVGQMRFDIDASERVQDILQLKYADECFVLTVSYIETHVDNPALEIRPDRTVMLRFELKNLGSFTTRTDPLSHVFGDVSMGKNLQ